MASSTASTEQNSHGLFQRTQKALSSLSNVKWIGSIMHPFDKGASGSVNGHDLCQLIGKTKMELRLPKAKAPIQFQSPHRFYFDTSEFPPPTTTDNGGLPAPCESFNDLKYALESAGNTFGSPLVYNGSNRRNLVFLCGLKCRHYRSRKNATNSGTYFRQDSMVNSEKAGRRVQGKSKSRRTSTKYCLSGEQTCKFRILVAWDEIGFYLNQQRGCPYHNGHSKSAHLDLAMPTGLIPKEEQEVMANLAESCIGAVACRNYAVSRMGKFLSKASVQFLQNTPTPNFGEDGTRQLPSNDVERLLDFFAAAKDVSYQVLWDVPSTTADGQDHTLVSEAYNKDSLGEISKTTTDHSTDEGMSDYQDEIAAARASTTIQPQDKVFICVAFANKEELALFHKFPALIYCDATSDTNRNRNHLITFTGRTTEGKLFIFLRVWVHNQRRVTFKWIFQVALRSFVPKQCHSLVQMVLVDGDPQQMGQLVIARDQYLVNAMVTTCGFHLITLGYKKMQHGPRKPTLGSQDRKKFDSIERILMHWLFSFMRPGYCEDEDEYNISKAMLFAWLSSKQVVEVFKPDGVDACKEWVRKVLSHEDKFVCYQRKHLRSYHQITTSPHEGTNFGMKTHAAAVKPCHTLLNAGKNLTLQGAMKTMEFNDSTARKMTKTDIWPQNATSNANESMGSSKSVVRNGVSMLQETVQRIVLFVVRRVDEGKWEVTKIETGGEEDDPSQKVPKFRRIRIVRLVEGDHLKCSCCHFESTGLPCAHQAAVISFHHPTWDEFLYTDVHPSWWKSWYMYAYSDEEKEVGALLHSCMVNSKGPKFPGNAPPISLEKYDPSTPTKHAWEKITNYSKKHIKSILESVENQFEGLTQDSNLEVRGAELTQDSNLEVREAELTQDSNLEGTEAEGREDWGGYEDDNNPTTPHNGYYETLKHATFEICNLLDNIHSTVSPTCAISFCAGHVKGMNAFRDELREALREAEANTSLNIRDGSSASVVHDIGGPAQKNRTVRRSHHSNFGKKRKFN